MTDPNIFDNPGQRFVDLTSDIGFHFVFGDENNKEVVIRLINILLGDEHHVVDIEYMNNEQLGEAMTSKGVRFDLHCMDTEGVRFVVEMQKVKHSRDFFARSVYYGSKLFSLQLKRGDETYNIPPVYVIGIMEGHLRHNTDRECVVRYTMSRNDGVEVAPKTISCIFAQLGFFDRKEEECRDLLDQWLYSLKHMKSLETIPEGFDDGEMSPLFAAADPSKFSEDKLISYNKAMMYERDYTSDMYYSRQEGREEGRAEGRAEATLANAKSLKAAGFPVEAIAQALDLTEAQVAEL